jgi:murein tripeptide amidase MpaA
MCEIKISSNFESGNIEVVECVDKKNVRLRIRKDTHSDYFQWFYFRVSGAKEQTCKFVIENAHEASYPEGWEEYHAVASKDMKEWYRVPTFYDGKALTIEHTPESDSQYYAYFQPYFYHQQQALVQKAIENPNVKLEVLGRTHEGRDIDMLQIGEPGPNKKNVWILARQHPGESMASFFVEGVMEKLLNQQDISIRGLLEKVVFYVVPNMNIDGSIAGNLRANAAGMNLNREWANPDPVKAPEVYYVLKKMDETGVDLNLDIHGDEGLPYNFIASIEGIPSYNDELAKKLTLFKETWLNSSPHFQVEHGYGIDEPGKANLNVCSKAIGERFKCLSMTVEMPFKDNKELPDLVYGWSAKRSIAFGRGVIEVVKKVADEL